MNGVMSEIKIPVPSLPEQQKIASCLSSLDEVITGEQQKLELLKQHKKGLLQNLFPQEGETVPKLRFKEFENSGEWEIFDLIDTADKNIKWSFTGGPFGSNLKAEDYTEDGIRIIQLQNIGDCEFIDDYKIYTSEEKANELLSCNIYSGEIILSKMGDPVGRACIIPKHLERCVMASDGIRLVVDEKKFSKFFVYFLINSQQIREAIERKATGSTRKRIGLDDLKKIPLPAPANIIEQQKIASCLSSLDEIITAQTQKIEQLQRHKKGLLQGLFPVISNTNTIVETGHALSLQPQSQPQPQPHHHQPPQQPSSPNNNENG
jgi:type I restriction enzyme S subunit